MINFFEVIETNEMIKSEHLDVRTLTMGISLLDCSAFTNDEFCENIYNKIVKKAGRLVEVGEKLSRKYGVPIVNKRISITPIAIAAASVKDIDYVEIAKTLDKAAKEIGVNFIGGFSALVDRGMTDSDKLLIESLPEVLSQTERVCSSVNVGSTRYGINMDAVRMLGAMIKKTSYLSRHDDSIGCAKFVVFTNAPDDNPFMAGAFHGVTGGDCVLNVGVSGPGVVLEAVKATEDKTFETLCKTIKQVSFKITRLGQMIGKEAADMLGVDYGIIDLSLAPTPAQGDSIADILCAMGLEYVGAPGTTAALAILNDQVKKGGLMASSYVGGLSGAFIPVSEDRGMIESVKQGAITLEKLEAMTCVCSVGLDMVGIAGDTSEETISGIIADEMAIGMINSKTTGVRIIPVYGKKVGDEVAFGGLLGTVPIMPVNDFGCVDFVNRKGNIPAPVHSFKN